LLSLGFAKFDAVNMIGFNAPEWFIANFAAIAAGGVAAGIYTTNQADACHYVASHCNARVILCQGLTQLEKFYEISKDLPALKALVVYGEALAADVKDKMISSTVPVYTFDDFKKLGKDVPDDVLKERSNGCKPGETCTLIYTSGTTG
jgi:long-chain-fatty-acid--CoA ligase ACSBG